MAKNYQNGNGGGHNGALATASGRPEVEVANRDTVADLLQSEYMQQSLAAVLPKHMTPEKVVKLVLVACSRNPKLLECTKGSLLNSVMEAAKLGLPCDGTLGQGYLVPFWNGTIRKRECTFIPGYRGLIKLARQSQQIADIRAELVYAGDHFGEFDLGTQTLDHKRGLDVDTADENIRGAYMVAEFKDGGRHIEIMTMTQLLAIMQRSPSKNRQGEIVGPWKTDFAEMCRKTVVRRGAKYLPMSIEDPLAQALEYNNGLDDKLNKLLELPAAPTPTDVIEGEVGEAKVNKAQEHKIEMQTRAEGMESSPPRQGAGGGSDGPAATPAPDVSLEPSAIDDLF